MFLELPCLSLVRLYVDINMYSHFYFRLHQDLHRTLPSPNKSARSFFPGTTKPNGNSTEHCSIQKDTVSFALDTGHITGLLSSILCGDSISNVYRFNSASRLGLAIHNISCFSQLIFEPVPLLLEDHRSAASSERCNQTTVLLLVKLDLQQWTPS